jgi:hypothetical protein
VGKAESPWVASHACQGTRSKRENKNRGSSDMSLFKFVVDYLADSDRSLVRIAHLAALFRAGEDYLLFICYLICYLLQGRWVEYSATHDIK